MPIKTLTSKKAKKKVGIVLGEFKRGALKSGSGKPVTSHKQALAIAMSEARRVLGASHG